VPLLTNLRVDIISSLSVFREDVARRHGDACQVL
jgi:hypothetical protein